MYKYRNEKRKYVIVGKEKRLVFLNPRWVLHRIGSVIGIAWVRMCIYRLAFVLSSDRIHYQVGVVFKGRMREELFWICAYVLLCGVHGL